MRNAKALGICAVLLTGVIVGLVSAGPESPLGCPPETYFTEATGGAERTNGYSVVYFDVVVRRYSQVMSNCMYRQWIETAGGHATEAEYNVYSPTYAVTSFVVVRDQGTINWASVAWYKHDTETYQVYSGCAVGGVASCSVSHIGMGSPIPGNLHHYYKTGNLPPAYYGDAITVEINANLFGMSWPAPVRLSLLSPP